MCVNQWIQAKNYIDVAYEASRSREIDQLRNILGAVSCLQLLLCFVGDYFVRDPAALAIVDRQIRIIIVRICRDNHYSSTKVVEVVGGGVRVS